MTLISERIDHFLGGVSQQDEKIRDASQASEQVNCLTDIANGLIKRPPFEHLAEIEADPSEYVDTLVHLINRDLDEKFRAVIRNGDLKVFDVADGSEVTVEFPNGKDYLSGPNFRALTLSNTTFIINQDKIVRRADTDTNPRRDPEALVYVRQGDFSIDYEVAIGAISITHTTSATARDEIDTAVIAQDILDAFEAVGGFTDLFSLERIGSTLYVVALAGADFDVQVKDGLSDQGLLVVKERVQRFEDLPLRAKDGFTVEVTGDPGTEYDNFFVVYDEGPGPEDHGVWRETLAPGTPTDLDASTMPHQLVLRGALTGRATSLGGISSPMIIMSAGVEVEKDFWEDLTVNVGTPEELIVTLAQSLDGLLAINEHNSFFHRELSTLTVENTGVIWEARYGMLSEDLLDGETVTVTLQVDTGAGWVTQDSRVHDNTVSGWTPHILSSDTNLANGNDIRLRMEYLTGDPPGAANRAYLAEHYYGVVGGTTIKEHALVFQYPTEQTLVIPKSNIFPKGYDVTLTTSGEEQDSFVYTPNADVGASSVGQALRDLLDEDADYVVNLVDFPTRAELTFSLVSTGIIAALIEPEFDPATYARFSDPSLADLDVVGATVRNITDGSEGLITAKLDGSINVSGGLSGGIDNTFERLDILEIVKDGDYFVFREGSWRGREVGSLTVNPFPEFVDRTITDMTFYQNRLGFIFGDQIHFSVAGDLLNLFRITAAQLRDDDAIAAQAANSVETVYHSAIIWDKQLYLVAETGITLVSGEPVLTPRSLRMDFVAAYENTPEIRPIVVGQSMFLFRYFSKENAVQVQEVFRQDVDVLDRVDLTRHVPTYLQGEPLVAFGSSAQGFVGLVTDEGFYVYRFFNNGNERVISSWSKWTLPVGMTVVGADVISGEVGVVATTGESVVVMAADLDINPLSVDSKVKHLDRRVTEDEATPVHAGGTTTWTLPYDISTDGSEGTLVIYRTDTLVEIPVTGRPQVDEVTAAGDHEATPVYIGITYEQKYVPTPIYKRDQTGRPDTRGTLVVTRIDLNYHESTDAVVTVTPTGKSSHTHVLDESLEDGVLSVQVYAADYVIEITNDTPGALCLTSADWEGSWIVRSRRG